MNHWQDESLGCPDNEKHYGLTINPNEKLRIRKRNYHIGRWDHTLITIEHYQKDIEGEDESRVSFYTSRAKIETFGDSSRIIGYRYLVEDASGLAADVRISALTLLDMLEDGGQR